MPIKILRKNDRKKFFLTNLFSKFVRKISYNIKIFSSDYYIKNIKIDD